MAKVLTLVLLLFTLYVCSAPKVRAQTTEFTYQGSLKDGANPANGNYDFEFALYDAASAGIQLGSTQSRNGVAVSNGGFSVSLDFGNQFPGASRFLELRVRPTGGGAFTPLAPRQQIVSAPYSIKSRDSNTLGGIDSGGFIKNSTSQQPASNFDISGNGTAGGTFSANVINATTQYTIAGSQVLSVSGGSILVGRGNGSDTVQVSGPFLVHLEQGGGNAVCRNANDALSSCSSSLRYKENVAGFSGGLKLLGRLRPVAFDWKAGRVHDVGLIAEEVANVEPLLVTHNNKGEIEGVKYDRIGVVLINAVKEQQEQIDAMQKRIESQNKQINALTKLVCKQNRRATVCRQK
jgi:hypothetical protein